MAPRETPAPLEPFEPVFAYRLACESPEREQPLVSLREHAHRLHQVVAELGHWGNPSRAAAMAARQGALMKASDALKVVAALEDVWLNTGSFDRSLMMCGRALSYVSSESDELSDYLCELLRFFYAWAACEKVAESIGIRPARRDQSRIPAICRYLSGSGAGEPMPVHYSCALGHLKHLLRLRPETQPLAAVIRGHEDGRADWHISGAGLRAGRMFRNEFAHGDVSLPGPEDWGGVGRLEHAIASCLTRVLVFTSQMLLVNAYGEVLVWVDTPWTDADEADADEPEDMHLPLRALSRQLHTLHERP